MFIFALDRGPRWAPWAGGEGFWRKEETREGGRHNRDGRGDVDGQAPSSSVRGGRVQFGEPLTALRSGAKSNPMRTRIQKFAALPPISNKSPAAIRTQ